jgi:hypothetical protein
VLALSDRYGAHTLARCAEVTERALVASALNIGADAGNPAPLQAAAT